MARRPANFIVESVRGEARGLGGLSGVGMTDWRAAASTAWLLYQFGALRGKMG
jgi:hypothetical protein